VDAPVQGIADDGVADSRQVRPDLMPVGARDAELDQGPIACAFEQARFGATERGAPNPHPATIARVGLERQIDRQSLVEPARAHDGQVFFVQRAGGDRRPQLVERTRVARGEDQPRGVGVQAVEQPGLDGPIADTAHFGVPGEQGVRERVGLAAIDGGGGQTRRLADHDQIGRLQPHVERDIGVGQKIHARGDADALPGEREPSLLCPASVHPHGSAREQPCGSPASELGDARQEQLVEALALLVGRDHERDVGLHHKLPRTPAENVYTSRSATSSGPQST